jgi:hypothetical protein
MFDPYCENHGSRILLPTSAITALVANDEGMTAHFICYCGAPGVWVADRSIVARVRP